MFKRIMQYWRARKEKALEERKKKALGWHLLELVVRSGVPVVFADNSDKTYSMSYVAGGKEHPFVFSTLSKLADRVMDRKDRMPPLPDDTHVAYLSEDEKAKALDLLGRLVRSHDCSLELTFADGEFVVRKAQRMARFYGTTLLDALLAFASKAKRD
jgi:hypothetical protein